MIVVYGLGLLCGGLGVVAAVAGMVSKDRELSNMGAMFAVISLFLVFVVPSLLT